MRAQKKKTCFISAHRVHLSNDQLKQGQRYFKLIHPTEEEERIRFSVTLALNAFLSTAFDIDEFKNIIYKVLDRPSIWSVITQFGVNRGLWYDPQNVHPVDIKYLGINLPAYEQPLQLDLNGKAALLAKIIMTAAQPPLQNCAGIVEIYAEHPVKHENKLVIQLIAARPSDLDNP